MQHRATLTCACHITMRNPPISLLPTNMNQALLREAILLHPRHPSSLVSVPTFFFFLNGELYRLVLLCYCQHGCNVCTEAVSTPLVAGELAHPTRGFGPWKREGARRMGGPEQLGLGFRERGERERREAREREARERQQVTSPPTLDVPVQWAMLTVSRHHPSLVSLPTDLGLVGWCLG